MLHREKIITKLYKTLRTHPFSKSHVIIAVLVFAVSLAAIARSVVYSSTSKNIGTFQSVCHFSQRISDDPIVFPGKPGASHTHDFFGASKPDAFSTNDTIRLGKTTCSWTTDEDRKDDKSAYWVPSLYVDGKLVNPQKLITSYSTGYRDKNAIEPFPAGLRMIAGSPSGEYTPADFSGRRVVSYGCGKEGAVVESSGLYDIENPPTCNMDSLTLTIEFPDCWDGVNSDSKNHKSHLAYSHSQGIRLLTGFERYICPSSHPKHVPQLTYELSYPAKGGPTTKLDSGPAITAHADFMNGWNQEVLSRLIVNCLHRDVECQQSDVANL